MPKRKNDKDSEDYIGRKIRKMEKRLRKFKNKRHRRLSSESSDTSKSEQGSSSPVTLLSEVGQEPNDSLIINNDMSSDVNLEPNPGPSVEVIDPEDCVLDNDIFQLLGESPTDTKKTGDNIQKDIALRWEHVAISGLSKDARKTLLEQYLVPSNCLKLAAPLLNAEIKAALSDIMVGKDKASHYKQTQITSVIACIGVALTKMFSTDIKDPSILKPLLDGAQLLCDLQFSESMKRRSLICATIKKEIKPHLYESKIDSYLFGENLADALKAAKAVSKSGSEIKVSKPKATPSRGQAQTLNTKPQSGYSRQPTRRRQAPAAYPPPLFHPPQRRPYTQSFPDHQMTTPAPPPPPPTQQRSKQRPYQRR